MNHREYAKLIEQAREKIKEYTTQIDNKKRIIAELKQQSNESDQQLIVTRQSLQLLEQNLQEKERQKGRLDNEITKRQENLEDINKLIKESLKISPEEKMALSNSELAKLKQEIEHNKNELSYLKEKYQKVNSEKQEIQREISKQEKFAHELKAQVAQLNAQKVEVTEGINGLETRHKKLIENF